MQFQIELTDTFGGEANYTWVRRATFEAPDNATRAVIVRRAKRAIDLHARHRTTDFGDCIQLDFPNWCARAFITHKE